MLGQMKALWQEMPPRRRLILTGAAGSVFLLLIILSFTLSRGSKGEVLFSSLHAADAAEVLQRLEESGINYDISQDASGRATISVPRHVVYRTRIEMAAEGLPRRGSVGFEIFDETQLGMTDDVRRINLRRAINGELERTIRALDVVDDVRVQVSIPESRLFISQQEEATAAVMLTLRPGLRLTQDQVRAVQRLVGATVDGLDPDDVFVVDSRGNPLSDQLSQLGSNGGLTSVEKQIVMQQAVSSEYGRQIRTMLEAVFGAGRVEALVAAQINFDMVEEVVNAFESPAGARQGQGLVRSEQRSEESFVGSSGQPSGVPGVESNVPGYVGADDGESEYNRMESIINYELTQVETRRVMPPGAVKSMSVGVWIDSDLSEEEEAAIADTLRAALGLNLDRGDEVVVASMPFAAQAVAALPVEGEPVTSGLLIPALIAVGLIVAALIAVILRRRRREEAATVDVVIDDEEDEDVALDLERKLTMDDRRRILLQEEITEAARTKPQDVAQLLKGWLTDD